MQIECHTAKIIQKWSAAQGQVLNGIVLVEFTLRDETRSDPRLRSRLVEHVTLEAAPDFSEQLKTRKLTRCAVEQVRRYFEGDGARENVFTEELRVGPRSGLSPEAEAELEAELRSIERDFALAV